MPPVIHVDAVEGAIVSQSIRFLVPPAARPRDTLIAIIATPSTNDGPDFDADELEEWEGVAELVGATYTLWVLRRESQAGDVSAMDVPFLDAIAAATISALLVYRNLNNGAELVGSSSTNIAASTNFVCPSRTLTTYSDLYIGIAFVSSAAVAVTPPAGGTERIDVTEGALALEVFDILPEVVGATGTKTATTGANQSGIAASLAFAADALVGFGKSFTVDPLGAFGLPRSGV